LIKKYKKVNRILTKEEEKRLEKINSSEGHDEIGLIAQDLGRTEFSYMVSSNEDKFAVNYVSLIAMLCEELKRKRNEVNNLKNTFEQNKIKLQNEFERLEKLSNNL